LFEILYTSQNDRRFSQWLKCFEILFDYSSEDIYREYLELRKGILYLGVAKLKGKISNQNMKFDMYGKFMDNISIFDQNLLFEEQFDFRTKS